MYTLSCSNTVDFQPSSPPCVTLKKEMVDILFLNIIYKWRTNTIAFICFQSHVYSSDYTGDFFLLQFMSLS